MNTAYYKAIGRAIRAQAGNLADFIEDNPARAQKEDLYANIFLCFTGIMGAILHLDIPVKDFSDILGRLFCKRTGLEVMQKISEWEEEV